MELAAFEKADGPLSVHLDEVLKKMNVERQAYHGKSFIGKYVHTCCKVTQFLPLEREFVESQMIILYNMSLYYIICHKVTNDYIL